MGGSGGGSGGGGGGGFPGSSGGGGGAGSGVDCYQLTFETTVASPVASILATLSVRDICDLTLLSGPTRIAVVTSSGAVLGAIANRWEDLVGCIGQGVAFEAEMLTVTSPVRVRVRPVP